MAKARISVLNRVGRIPNPGRGALFLAIACLTGGHCRGGDAASGAYQAYWDGLRTRIVAEFSPRRSGSPQQAKDQFWMEFGEDFWEAAHAPTWGKRYEASVSVRAVWLDPKEAQKRPSNGLLKDFASTLNDGHDVYAVGPVDWTAVEASKVFENAPERGTVDANPGRIWLGKPEIGNGWTWLGERGRKSRIRESKLKGGAGTGWIRIRRFPNVLFEFYVTGSDWIIEETGGPPLGPWNNPSDAECAGLVAEERQWMIAKIGKILTILAEANASPGRGAGGPVAPPRANPSMTAASPPRSSAPAPSGPGPAAAPSPATANTGADETAGNSGKEKGPLSNPLAAAMVALAASLLGNGPQLLQGKGKSRPQTSTDGNEDEEKRRKVERMLQAGKKIIAGAPPGRQAFLTNFLQRHAGDPASLAPALQAVSQQVMGQREYPGANHEATVNKYLGYGGEAVKFVGQHTGAAAETILTGGTTRGALTQAIYSGAEHSSEGWKKAAFNAGIDAASAYFLPNFFGRFFRQPTSVLGAAVTHGAAGGLTGAVTEAGRELGNQTLFGSGKGKVDWNQVRQAGGGGLITGGATGALTGGLSQSMRNRSAAGPGSEGDVPSHGPEPQSETAGAGGARKAAAPGSAKEDPGAAGTAGARQEHAPAPASPNPKAPAASREGDRPPGTSPEEPPNGKDVKPGGKPETAPVTSQKDGSGGKEPAPPSAAGREDPGPKLTTEERKAHWEEGRRSGQKKVDEVDAAAKEHQENLRRHEENPTPETEASKNKSHEELTAKVDAVQQDKHAWRKLNEPTPKEQAEEEARQWAKKNNLPENRAKLQQAEAEAAADPETQARRSLRKAYNENLAARNEQSDEAIRQRIAREYGVTPEKVKIVKPTNAANPSDPIPEPDPAGFARQKGPVTHGDDFPQKPASAPPGVSGKKVPADRDVTIRVEQEGADPITGKRTTGFIDVPASVTARISTEEFYKARHGNLPYVTDKAGNIVLNADGKPAIDSQAVAEYAKKMDYTPGSRLSADAYGRSDRDLQTATDPRLRGRDFTDVTGVGKTMEHKQYEWRNEGLELQAQAGQKLGEAKRAEASGDHTQAAQLREESHHLLTGAEAKFEEGYRQTSKQFTNLVEGRVDEQYHRFASPAPSIPPKLEQAAKILENCGKAGYSPAEVERDLLKLNYTPEKVVQQMSSIIEALQKLRK